MNKIRKFGLIGVLLAFSFSAFAVDQHTFIYRVDVNEPVAPHSNYTMPTIQLPRDLDATHVWTGVGMCMLSKPGNTVGYDPFTEKLVLQGWLINVDTAEPSQYYFNSELWSNGERCVYQSFSPENNVHMHHFINAGVECKNFGSTTAFCRARIWVHYKK